MTSKTYNNSPEPESSAPEENPPPQESQESEAITPSLDPAAHLQAELDAAKVESDQWRDRFLRKAAEFDNYRKRIEKEKADTIMLAKSSVLLEFLSIADACERALGSFDNSLDIQSGLGQYREGVELLYKQMLDTLARIGVTPIQSKGQMFNPHLHEALAREVTSEVKENTITQELRRGYLFKDRLLRPAQVNVAVHPPPENQNA
jgi:molecular chaperone GrpE